MGINYIEIAGVRIAIADRDSPQYRDALEQQNRKLHDLLADVEIVLRYKQQEIEALNSLLDSVGIVLEYINSGESTLEGAKHAARVVLVGLGRG